MLQRNNRTQILQILLVEDDEDDILDTVQAAADSGNIELTVVRGGKEMMEYLRRTHSGDPSARTQRPDLILLDLNLPEMSGYEVLSELKNDSQMRSIPVVALTVSNAPHDIDRCYGIGITSFIVKPADHSKLVEVMIALSEYWRGIVRLPGNHRRSGRRR